MPILELRLFTQYYVYCAVLCLFTQYYVSAFTIISITRDLSSYSIAIQRSSRRVTRKPRPRALCSMLHNENNIASPGGLVSDPTLRAVDGDKHYFIW